LHFYFSSACIIKNRAKNIGINEGKKADKTKPILPEIAKALINLVK
jgi:hypothetical protein|tara:strand:+ start:389 stop:526 length:138 start_codon:yes stop_codon:yes gene_type:complete